MSLASSITDLRSFPEDALRAWRANGCAGVRQEIHTRTLDRIGGYVRQFVIETDLSRLSEVTAPAQVDIRLFNGPDWSLLGDMGRSRFATEFDQAANAGRICLVAWKERVAVGYAWFSPAVERRYEGYDLPLPAEAIYVSQLEVIRNQRDQGVATALLSTGLRLGLQLGFRRSWLTIRRNDVSRLRAIASVGSSRVLGTAARIKLLSWARSRYCALHPPVPIAGTGS